MITGKMNAVIWTPAMTELFKNVWDVFCLFTIPIGGGIPAGVLLAQKRGLSWIMMTILYFLSDVVLACFFEPVMALTVNFARRSPRLNQIIDEVKKRMDQTLPKYGVRPGHFTLIMISFGVDPMTGRSVAKAAGHGFISGWMLAIAGDMIYFLVIMLSTLWLGSILGDGTLTTFIILVLMIVVPAIVRRIRDRSKK